MNLIPVVWRLILLLFLVNNCSSTFTFHCQVGWGPCGPTNILPEVCEAQFWFSFTTTDGKIDAPTTLLLGNVYNGITVPGPMTLFSTVAFGSGPSTFVRQFLVNRTVCAIPGVRETWIAHIEMQDQKTLAPLGQDNATVTVDCPQCMSDIDCPIGKCITPSPDSIYRNRCGECKLDTDCSSGKCKSGKCGGGAKNDPKFNGFDGETYFVKGDVGKIYNIISEKHFQLNSLFEQLGAMQHQTFMQEMGMLIGSQYRITLGIDGVMHINDEPHVCKSTSIKNELFNLTCVVDGSWRRWTMHVPHYHLVFNIRKQGIMINMDASYHAGNDPYEAHGLLGQTADGDHRARKGKPHSQQGEGWIEGNYKEYEVSDLLATTFKYNKFIGLDKTFD